ASSVNSAPYQDVRQSTNHSSGRRIRVPTEAEFGGGGRLVKRALIALAAVLAVLAVSIPGAFGRTLEAAAPKATPGVTSSTITISGHIPLGGAAPALR